MIDRSFLIVSGPAGGGKTTFIEHLLQSVGEKHLVAVARCVRRPKARTLTESKPRRDAELKRYSAAGALDVAKIAFSDREEPDAFWETSFMLMNPADSVILEGDRPGGNSVPTDLAVWVGPPTADGSLLLEASGRQGRATRSVQETRETDPAQEAQALLASLLGGDGAPSFLSAGGVFGPDAISRAIGPQRRRWTIAEGADGVERAGLVVLNVRNDEERAHADRMIEDLQKIRSDREIFLDVAGITERRHAITAVVTDLSDPRDAELRKALTRARRTIRQGRG